MQRRQFDDAGKICNSLGGYPEAMRQTAHEENAALIDLNAMSVAFYEALGPTKSPIAFANNGRDATHHSPYRAYELAKCVVERFRDEALSPAALARSPGSGAVSQRRRRSVRPAQPDPPERRSLPLDPQFQARAARKTPGGN
jgi:hypothetical protein